MKRKPITQPVEPSPASFLPMKGEIDNTPKCIPILTRNPHLIETIRICIDPCETESRRKFGKCKSKCCLACELLREGKPCLNTKTKRVERPDGTQDEIQYDSVCEAFSILK